jgi:hypothetical protein
MVIEWDKPVVSITPTKRVLGRVARGRGSIGKEVLGRVV